ncbi:MAG: radical SAM protein [Candidatus Schekmanbacteria bacterium]|nr:radical SAM protein [Candidatus Schekmanbacteria bacterium]
MQQPAPRRLDFRDHRRELGTYTYVYPVLSRRSHGVSVGINLNPDKRCNFACPYCQVDRTVPGRASRVAPERVEAELNELLGLAASGAIWAIPPFDTVAPDLRRVSDTALAGDGEPTSSRYFGAVIDICERLLRRHGLLDTRIVVLTNATLLHRPAVREALERLQRCGGEVWAKLDAGTPEYYALVNRSHVPFQRILRNLLDIAVRQPIVLQSMFMRYGGVPPAPQELDAYCDRIREIRAAGGQISQVQVYSVARVPADPAVSPLEAEVLAEIADRVRHLGVSAEVFPGADP